MYTLFRTQSTPLQHPAFSAPNDDDDASEFVRRLTSKALIGNADMHVKNWSVIYPDRRTARLAPASPKASPWIRLV
ncbi:HipA domain-containing protein [Lentisalinibacter salinarum]|uniref:HipA domain-containing protein n=1 Tax=Lentisalinibacter salinarum TaxID=2992239 RepID=UPI003865496B